LTKFRQLFSLSRAEIDKAFKSSQPILKQKGFKVLRASLFDVCAFEDPTKSFGKLLIVTPRRVGKAHERNLIRRRLKNIFYTQKLFKAKFVWIILVYPEAKNLDFQTCQNLLVEHLK